MSEPTLTRKQLRRLICQELQMPFFRRYSAGEGTIDANSTTTKIKDTMLTQTDGFWSGHWFYGLTVEDLSVIRSFVANDKQFMLEVPMASTPNAGDKYEIHSVWNATEIHKAINRAIHMAERIFPVTQVNTTLILQEDKLSYTVSSLSPVPFSISKLYIENPGSILKGQATGGSATSIVVESVPSDITTDWKISIYSGTGKGQIKNYASNAGNTIIVDTNWTTPPDSTSKYTMWNPTQEVYDWKPVYDFYHDSKEWPDEIRLRYRMPTFYGLRLKIEYLALHTEPSTDASTISIPSEYIVPKVCSILHGMRLNDNKADRDLHFAEMDRYDKQAESFLTRFAQHNPDSMMMRAERDYGYNIDDADPLGWQTW